MAMVEHLPALPRDRLEPFIIELDESVQAELLWRSDIELTNLRRAIFFGDREVKSDSLVEAAARHPLEITEEDRSEGRRGGKRCDRTCRSRWLPVYSKKKENILI